MTAYYSYIIVHYYGLLEFLRAYWSLLELHDATLLGFKSVRYYQGYSILHYLSLSESIRAHLGLPAITRAYQSYTILQYQSVSELIRFFMPHYIYTILHYVSSLELIKSYSSPLGLHYYTIIRIYISMFGRIKAYQGTLEPHCSTRLELIRAYQILLQLTSATLFYTFRYYSPHPKWGSCFLY